MGNNLNDIVTVDISINTPAIDSASFDNLLIVGLPPLEPKGELPDVGAYGDLSEVVGAGYSAVGNDADPVGVAARIAFSQNPKPSKVYIAAIKESETDVLEPPVDTLERALGTDGWYVICPAGIDDSEYEAMAEWTEAQNKMLAYTFLSKEDPVGSVYYRSHGWCGLETDEQEAAEAPQANSYLHVAVAAKALSHPAGSETWAFRQLAAVYPSELSGTLKKALAEGHSNYFAKYSGRSISMNGQVRAGEWIDIIRGRDWLQNDMQLRLFNLFLMNPKIPYTNGGIALVQNEMIASLKSAQARRIIAEDEYGDGGELIPGFTVSVPNSADITATEKASRVLKGCRFSARPAGAIHAVSVSGALTY